VTTFVHRTADFTGVAAALLRDQAVVSGLLVAAAGAAGLSAEGSPAVRERGAHGVSAVLLLSADGCHMAAHAFPKQGLLLLDILVPSERATDKAIDVFTRKLVGAKLTKRDYKR